MKSFFSFSSWRGAVCTGKCLHTEMCNYNIFLMAFLFCAAASPKPFHRIFMGVSAASRSERNQSRFERRGPHPATLDEQFNKEVWSDDLEFPQLFRHSHAIIPQRRSTRFALMNLSKTRSNLIVTTTRRLTDLDLHLYTELYNTISLLSIESRINSMTNVGNCVTSQTRG